MLSVTIVGNVYGAGACDCDELHVLHTTLHYPTPGDKVTPSVAVVLFLCQVAQLVSGPWTWYP